jgi:hypothetical protein
MTMTEVDILRPAIEHLTKDWEVYQEVPVVLDGQVVSIDTVAVRAACLRVVEGKRYLEPELVDQCRRWRGLAHQIYAVAGEPQRKTRSHMTQRGRLQQAGIGLVYVSESGEIRPQFEARIDRRANRRVIETALCDAQQSGPAGGSAGVTRARPDRWDAVRTFLQQVGSATAKEIALELNMTNAERRDFITAAKRRIRGIVIDLQAIPYSFRALETDE